VIGTAFNSAMHKVSRSVEDQFKVYEQRDWCTRYSKIRSDRSTSMTDCTMPLIALF
jgi:hypothetical protein